MGLIFLMGIVKFLVFVTHTRRHPGNSNHNVCYIEQYVEPSLASIPGLEMRLSHLMLQYQSIVISIEYTLREE